MLFFSLSDWLLIVVLFAIVFGATIAGLMAGRRLHHRSDKLREPMATMQAAVLGFMALILAFGLSLAVGRYQDRRASVVEEANAIGTTYLRAQTLAEPVRSRSLDLLVRYTDASIRFAQSVPDSASARRAFADESQLQRQLWSLAGQALDAAPVAERAASLRGQPQRHDRHSDDAGVGSQQPGADGGARPRSDRRRGRASVAGLLFGPQPTRCG